MPSSKPAPPASALSLPSSTLSTSPPPAAHSKAVCPREQGLEEDAEGLGSGDGLALEAEEVSDFARGENQARGQFGEVDAVVGGEKAIEIQRKILVGSIGDDANGGAGNVFAEAKLADGVRFHFDRVHAGDLPELVF